MERLIKEPKTFDLHTHTTESDGTYTPKELIERAYERGLKGIAITDHDTVAGLSEGRKRAEELGLEFIPGIEFSCNIGDLEVHILGYFIDPEDEVFKGHLKRLADIRDERNRRLLEKLRQYRINLDMEELKKEAGGDIISKAHIANLMVKKGYVYTRGAAFKEYMGKHGVAYVPKENFTPEQAVEIIVQNGGIASLAHPALITTRDRVLEDLIVKLKAKGLSGIEANYSGFTEAEKLKYWGMAVKHNLAVTGGSDFHGGNREGVDVGDEGLNEEEFKQLKNLLG